MIGVGQTARSKAMRMRVPQCLRLSPPPDTLGAGRGPLGRGAEWRGGLPGEKIEMVGADAILAGWSGDQMAVRDLALLACRVQHCVQAKKRKDPLSPSSLLTS